MEGARSARGRDERCLEDDVFLRYFAGDLGHDEESKVRAHVVGCDDCRAALAEEARQQAASFDASAPSSRRLAQRTADEPHEPAPGDTIEGRYRIDKRIGHGGMGIVYAAKDLERGVPVAVKIMNAERADEPDSVARFLRETRMVACVDSEHVVKVYDVGTLDNGTPYMATELLVGKDLADRAHQDGKHGKDGKALDVETAVEWILQATRGLAAAHAAGIIHRDVKLSNLFLARGRDGSDVVKVLDFGLCKSASPSEHATESMPASLTTADSMMGTPHYMSPEQYVSARDVSAATDVWALGICLYHLLTGRVPFDGPNVTNLCAKVVRGEFTAPRKLREEIPIAIENVILKCLARDPESRYRDGRELLDALAKAIDENAAPTLDSNRDYKKNEALATTQPMPPPVHAPHPRGVHTTSRNESLPLPSPAPRKTSPLITAALVMAAALFVIAFVVKRHRAHANAEEPSTAAPAMTPPIASPIAAPVATPIATVSPTTPTPTPAASGSEPSAKAVATAAIPKATHPPMPRARAVAPAAPTASKDPLYDKY